MKSPARPGGSATPRYGAGHLALTLCVLLVANLLNYADRAILAPLFLSLEKAFGVSNAELGFLFGTSFVLFNSLVGIGMGRLSDRWRRDRILAAGVALWSLMTLAGAFAETYWQLAATRIGVGIGEAVVSGIGYSLLADMFAPRWRSTAFGVFLIGPFGGQTLAFVLGGWVTDGWDAKCARLTLCAFKDWQAGFILFGLPGLGVALLCLLIGEPKLRRGETIPRFRSLLGDALTEISFAMPGIGLLQLRRLAGRGFALANVAAAAIMACTAGVLIALTGDWAQWIAVALGLYGIFGWSLAQKFRDRQLFTLTVASPAFIASIAGGALNSGAFAGLSSFSLKLAVVEFGLTKAEASSLLGAVLGAGSLVGTLVGSLIIDLGARRTFSASLVVGGIGAVLAAVVMVLLLATTPSAGLLAVCVGAISLALTSWPAGLNAMLQDMVLPEMRARAATFYAATAGMLAGSLGPYGVGRVADAAGSVRTGLAYLLVLLSLALLSFWLALRWMPAALAQKLAVEGVGTVSVTDKIWKETCLAED